MDGTSSRLFALEQRLDISHAIDIADFTTKLSDETFSMHIEQFGREVATIRTPADRQNLLKRVPLFHEMSYVPPTGSAFWGLVVGVLVMMCYRKR